MNLTDYINDNKYYQYTEDISYSVIGYSVSSLFSTPSTDSYLEYGFSNTTYKDFRTSSLTAKDLTYYSVPIILQCQSMFDKMKIKDFAGREYSNTAYPYFGFTISSAWYNDYVTDFGDGNGRLSMILSTSHDASISVNFTKYNVGVPPWILSDNVDLYLGYVGGHENDYVVHAYWFRNSATLFAIPICLSETNIVPYNPDIKLLDDHFGLLELQPTLKPMVYTLTNWINKIKYIGNVKCPSRDFNYTTNITFSSSAITVFPKNDNLDGMTNNDIKNTFIGAITLCNSDKVPMIVLSSKHPVKKSFKLGYNFEFEFDVFRG